MAQKPFRIRYYYSRAILRLPQRDVTAGFRLWRRETLKGMPLQRVHSNGYVFQVEMTYLAHCLDYTIGEIPFIFLIDKKENRKCPSRSKPKRLSAFWVVWWSYRDLRKAGKSARNVISQK